MTMPLSSAAIAEVCRPLAQQVAIRLVDETGSTNADLLAALDTLPGPTLLYAAQQTAGRGRAGRSWHSEAGKSLTFSLAWKFHLPLQSLVGLPLAVGVAIAEALAMFDVRVRLKWPNDVLLDGKKLAGILIESATASRVPHDASWAVIGIGINMAIDPRRIGEPNRPVANVPWLAELDRNLLLGTLLNALAEGMTRFEQEGFAGFMAQWNALHAYAGMPVQLMDQGIVQQRGTAVGVDASGRFLLDTGHGITAIMAGDVSLRPQEAS